MLVKMNIDPDVVDTIKRFTGEAVASKAFFTAALRAVELQNRVERLDKQVTKLMLERDSLRHIVSDARNAAIALVERAGQSDMFIEAN